MSLFRHWGLALHEFELELLHTGGQGLAPRHYSLAELLRADLNHNLQPGEPATLLALPPIAGALVSLVIPL